MDNKEFFTGFMNVKFEEAKGICPTHGEVFGRYAILANGDKVFECPACIADREEAEKKELEAYENEKKIIKYRDSNIEQEFFNKTLKDYKPVSDSQKSALYAVQDMIKNKSGKVILLGSNGVGKTMLGSCAVKELGGKIYSMYEISTMIRQSYTAKADKTELEIVKELASVPFLVIDELGRTKGSESELNWLSFVLDKRHTRNLPFMILSNTHLSSKCKNGGCSQCFENYINNDILSRLQQNTKLINVTGPDFRAN